MKQLNDIRDLMRKHAVDALIVPGTDPHAGEYIPEHWQERKFISAFSGSAGTAVITLDGGCLWTDSRYFLQAGEQLKASGFALQKDGEMGTPTIMEWLIATLGKGKTVAINPAMISVDAIRGYQAQLSGAEMNLFTDFDFIDAVWENRPSMPLDKVMVFSTEHSGMSTSDKLAKLRNDLAKAGANAMLITALDDIAWLTNMRGNDIDYNPVIISFVLVTEKHATMFLKSEKLTPEAVAHLKEAGIDTDEYGEILNALGRLGGDTVIAIDGAKCNYQLYKAIPENVKVVEIPSPVFNTKCIKNAVELAGTRRAMHKDGVALVRFWMWLEEMLDKKERVTELSAIAKLHDFRAEQEGYVSESFGTIAGYGEHGAIVHYDANEETNAELRAEGFFLLDSGGQYLDGTTDITRTVALGKVTDEMRRDYTLVLKGHLALGSQLFPYGTRGAQLDALARQFLWNNELHYGHGTGHGVGHFLNVHEGPQSIRLNENPTILEPGMILSNEPGLYRAGRWGIRIENLVAVADYANNVNDFGRFLRFENLTLFPYDSRSIDMRLLSPDELLQINYYHKMVYDELSPLLKEKEAAWLKEKTKAL